MAEVTFKQLEAVLAKAGAVVAEDTVLRVWRLLENPAGCERCGQPTKAATIKGNFMTLNCCGFKTKVSS